MKVKEEFLRLKANLLQDFMEADLNNPLENAEFLDEYDYISNFNQRIMEMSGELLKFNLDKEILNFIVTDLAGYFYQLQEKPYSFYDYLYAICFYTDLVEFGPEGVYQNFV